MISLHDNMTVRRTMQAAVIGLALPVLAFPISNFVRTLIFAIAAFLVTGSRPYWIYITIKTFPRDFRLLRVVGLLDFRMLKWEKNKVTVAKLFQKLVEQYPDKVAYHSEEGDWTFKRLNSFAARFAACLPKDAVVRNNPVAMVLGSKAGPRLIGAWLGMAQRGVPSALLPPASRMAALKHAILASKAKILIFGDELAEAISQIQDDPDLIDIQLFQYNFDKKDTSVNKNTTLINPEDESLPSEPSIEEIMKGSIRDELIYIYTSGTTGLPKAAIITNQRYLIIAGAANKVMDLDPNKDIFYTPLPLHHTAGGVLGAGQAICFGVTVAQRNKFSASNYISDCVKYKCTIGQYIGELCRFLLIAQQKSGTPVPDHNIRIMFGNGLRANIWNQFKTTFKIPMIYEFYGATEGNTNMVNNVSQEGAIGFLPRFASIIAPIMLIKCHQTTGEPMRDSRGLCTVCGPGEPGLLIGMVNHANKLYSYTGYVDKSANDKKLIKDVKKKGDCYFNSGDILVMDDFGFFYFKDRTGDTFRWRGENVSTAEVEGIMSSIIGLNDLVVYGVEIPHVEGKAGMAAIVDTSNKLDLAALIPKMNAALPPFARPIFIRVLSEMPITNTFKLIKKDLQEEAYDFNKVKDPLFFLDPKTLTYIPLTKSLYDDINENRIKF